jgi:hypothetical protein
MKAEQVIVEAIRHQVQHSDLALDADAGFIILNKLGRETCCERDGHRVDARPRCPSQG